MFSMRNRILVTGGAGYIGSHTVVELIESGYEPVIFDNLSNSSFQAIDRVSKLTNHSISFVEGDIRNPNDLERLFCRYQFEAVIHFAGLKSVAQSVDDSCLYYDNNVVGTLQLLKVMIKNNVKRIIFSSSATVYGGSAMSPIIETDTCGEASNPYGNTKWLLERALEDLYRSDEAWSIVKLRYFNPVGAHKSGMIGEDPLGAPNNLMPYITQTAIGRRERLYIYGNDYPTQDGTGVRDYIHVVDLAKGHVKALQRVLRGNCLISANLGTGVGYSVLDLVRCFEHVNQVSVPYEFVSRRPGDIACSYADPSFAKESLGWEATLNLYDMCRDAWRWQVNNPTGYLEDK